MPSQDGARRGYITIIPPWGRACVVAVCRAVGVLDMLGQVSILALGVRIHACSAVWRVEQGSYDSVAADLGVLQTGACFAVTLDLRALMAPVGEAVLA